MADYVLTEDSTSTLCVTFNKVLEKNISVEYSLTNEMISGKPKFVVLSMTNNLCSYFQI